MESLVWWGQSQNVVTFFRENERTVSITLCTRFVSDESLLHCLSTFATARVMRSTGSRNTQYRSFHRFLCWTPRLALVLARVTFEFR